MTVASSVTDTRGTRVEATADTAIFTGFIVPARLLINEVNPNVSGGKDLIELLVVEGGTVDKMTLVADGTTTPLATMPNVLVATGDIIVVHLIPATTDASETTGKDQYPASYNYNSAWDFVGSATGLSYTSNRVLRVKDALGATQDAVPFVNTTQTTTQFISQLQAIQAEGFWLPIDCGGVPCAYTGTFPNAYEVSVSWTGVMSAATGNSVQRMAGGVDTNRRDDWMPVGPSSFGFPTPSP
jgi:hypothetical protein